jgi:DNA (cytosine-5)-methyltransferase 1
MKLKHASLFSGIGGFDLAAEWMGWQNVFHCEIDPSKRIDLKRNFSNSIEYDDITTTDFKVYRGEIDVLTGGFPCQDASIAKQDGEGQKGLQGKRTGLAFQMLRAINEIKPTFVIAENVANFLKVNGGKDARTILSELARLGYNAEWRICYASEVGAPHQRARLYIVAYTNGIRVLKGQTFFSYVRSQNSQITWRTFGTTIQISGSGAWKIEPPILCLDDGLSSKLVKKQLHGYGNAIVPQLAHEIFKSIEESINNNCKFGFYTCTNQGYMCDVCDDGENYEHYNTSNKKGAIN